MAEKIFHIMIGTKGQLIKMAPIMLEMDKRGIEYNFINAGQHSKILHEIIKLFDLKDPDVVLNNFNQDVANIKQGGRWLLKVLMKSIFQGSEISNNKKGICLLHGDAPPALVGLIFSKFNNIRVAHIESGERTFNYMNPFPEELIRIIVDRFSNYLFASSDVTYQNIKNIKSIKYNVSLNTIFDSIQIAVNNSNSKFEKNDYVLVSIHRFETIYSKERMKIIINTIENVAKNNKVIFPLHESTKNRLLSLGMLNSLKNNKNINLLPLQNYFNFINLINNSKYVITDGGGPQQECYYLNKPCLLMRMRTERLGYQNVCLSKFNTTKIDDFLNNYNLYKHNIHFDKYTSPSKKIVDVLENELYNI